MDIDDSFVFYRPLKQSEWKLIDSLSRIYLPHGFTCIINKHSFRNPKWITTTSVYVKNEKEFNRAIDESLERYQLLHDRHKTCEGKRLRHDIIHYEYRKIVSHVILSNFTDVLTPYCISHISAFL